MPKIVDHLQRREQIALAACQVVANHGFEQATVVRIARASGYTTGMLAHYYESKQDIILAALRLMLQVTPALRVQPPAPQPLPPAAPGKQLTPAAALTEIFL